MQPGNLLNGARAVPARSSPGGIGTPPVHIRSRLLQRLRMGTIRAPGQRQDVPKSDQMANSALNLVRQLVIK